MSMPKFTTWCEDRDEVAAALLRSDNFLANGFAARRPLGNCSNVAQDVAEIIGHSGDLERAGIVWREMPAHMPDFMRRVLADHEIAENAAQQAAK